MDRITNHDHRPFQIEKISIASRAIVPIKIEEEIVEAEFISFHGIEDAKEHIAICFKPWQKNLSPLVRIHSECLTGDVFSSQKCDCGRQLNQANELLAKNGGILIYLRQEGRGIGLANKIAAYSLQNQGYDTYEANRLLNFPNDMRDYKIAAQILFALQIEQVRLFSNNPDKREQLNRYGIIVEETIATKTFLTSHNESYLIAKATKTNHSLSLNEKKFQDFNDSFLI